MVLIDIWESEVGKYMQILYLAYGIGGLIAPILIRPYQLPIPEEIADDPDAYLTFYKPEDVQIICPYIIISGTSVIIGLAFAFCYYVAINEEKKKEKIDEKDSNKQEKPLGKLSKSSQNISVFKIAVAVGWVALLGHVGFSMQLSFSEYKSLIFTFPEIQPNRN